MKRKITPNFSCVLAWIALFSASFVSISEAVQPPIGDPSITIEGGHIVVNDDDANNNQTWDKDEAPTPDEGLSGPKTPEQLEPKLQKFTFTAKPTHEPGTLVITADNISPFIKLWKDAGKNEAFVLNETGYGISIDSHAPIVFYVEGLKPTAAFNSIGFRATFNKAVGEIRFGVTRADIDIDSNNNGIIEADDTEAPDTAADPKEDEIEFSDKPEHPGKILLESTAAIDANGVAVSVMETAFAPLRITLHPPFSPGTAKVKFTCPASVPSSPANKRGLRLWKANGNGSVFIPAGQEIPWNDIAGSGTTATLYVEYVEIPGSTKTYSKEDILITVKDEAGAQKGYTKIPGTQTPLPGKTSPDGLCVSLLPVEVDAAIAPFANVPADLPDDHNASPPHDMDPGSFVIAPVEGYDNPGTRSRLTLTVTNPLSEGEFRLKAVNLPNVEIFATSVGGVAIPINDVDIVWPASDFTGPVILYVGAKTFKTTQAAEAGTLVFSYHPTSYEGVTPTQDTVKVTLDPAAIDAAIVRFANDTADLPDDHNASSDTPHDMEPGSLVIADVTEHVGVTPGTRSRLTLDVLTSPSITGTYTLKTTDPNIVFYENATGDTKSNRTWTDSDFAGSNKVTIYVGADPMSSTEAPKVGTIQFSFTSAPFTGGDSYNMSDTVKVTIGNPVDLDVDSNNVNDGFSFREGSAEEDKMEANPSLPGKIIAVPLDPDADKDGVPDFMDGFIMDDSVTPPVTLGGTLTETKFVQMIVNLPLIYDPNEAMVTFNYTMSSVTGLAPTAAPNSGFRIWTKDAIVARSVDPIPNANTAMGYLVKDGDPISWKKLAAHCKPIPNPAAYSGPAIILYIETVITSSGDIVSNNEEIKVTAKSDSSSDNISTEDIVNVDVRCTGGVKITGPKAIVVNDDDDNDDHKWDKDNDQLGFVDNDVQSITVTVVALDHPVWVTVTCDQIFSDVVPTPVGTGGLIDGIFPGETRTTPGGTSGSNIDGQSKKGWVSPTHTINVPAYHTIEQDLFIEGLRNSATVDDVVIKATITANPGLDAGTPPCLARKEAEHKMTVYQVDLDVDSNNINDEVFTWGSPEEDQIEASKTLPGKVIVTSPIPDANTDGIPDYENGVDGKIVIKGAQFTPMLLTLPEPFDPATATITFNYAEAQTGTPAKSGLRIWKHNASDLTNPRTTADHLRSSSISPIPIKWSDLPSGSSPRIKTLYIESVNSDGISPDGKMEIIVTAQQSGVTQAEDSVNVFLVPIDIEEVISDQIAGNEANKLPTAFFGGNPAKPENGHPNNPMLMACRSGSDARLMIKMNIPFAQAALIRVGVREPGQTTIISSVPSVPSPGKTPLSFTALAGTKLYEVVAGFDANGNAAFENSEVSIIFEKTPRIDKQSIPSTAYLHLLDKFRVVTQDDFDAARTTTDNHADAILIDWLDSAEGLLKAFARGAVTVPEVPEASTTWGHVLYGSPIPSAQGLAHPVGGKWTTPANNTTTLRFEWPETSDLAEDVVGSDGIDQMIGRLLLKHKATLAAAATATESVVVLNPLSPLSDDGINFADSDDHDQVHVALGACKFEGGMEVKIKKGIGTALEVSQVNCWGAILDLYDWAYDAKAIKMPVTGQVLGEPRECAKVQAGYATLAASTSWAHAGRVFFTKVNFGTGWIDFEATIP